MAWYEQSFGKDYLTVYRHRDETRAEEEVRRICGWLELPVGAEVLDLCCGMGRHSMALHALGYRVTGLDLSEALLAEARVRDARSQIEWVKGDMRRLPFARPFDAIVNLFTSFGYFDDDADNFQVVREIDRHLKPGGKWMIDFLNPDFVVSNLVPCSERVEGNLSIREERSLAEDRVVKRITIAEKNRDVRRYREQVRLYRLPDFENMVAATGLSIDRVYGDYHGRPYDPLSSPRMIMVGHRTGIDERQAACYTLNRYYYE